MDIQKEINEARKARDAGKLGVLQGLKSALTNTALRKGSVNAELTNLEILGVIRSQIKQREDSATAYEAAGRSELAQKEISEKTILEGYLPQPLDQIQLDFITEQAIVNVGAVTKKDAGRAIQAAVAMVAGRASNQEVSKLIMFKLS